MYKKKNICYVNQFGLSELNYSLSAQHKKTKDYISGPQSAAEIFQILSGIFGSFQEQSIFSHSLRLWEQHRSVPGTVRQGPQPGQPDTSRRPLCERNRHRGGGGGGEYCQTTGGLHPSVSIGK